MEPKQLLVSNACPSTSESLDDILKKIGEVKKNDRDKEKKIQALMFEGICAVQSQVISEYQNITENVRHDSGKMRSAREAAVEDFAVLRDEIHQPTDPKKVLADYAQAYANLLLGCPKFDPNISAADKENMDSGASGCSALDATNTGIIDYVKDKYSPQKHYWQDFINWLFHLDTHYSVNTFVSYQPNADRSYLGAGISGEVLVPFKKNPHFVLGGELMLNPQFGFTQPQMFGSELKTFELSAYPILLEGGYQTDTFSLLLQASAWFTATHVPESEQPYHPYSPNNPFLNPIGRVGFKANVWDNRIMIVAGYEGSPWGPGGYFAFGYHFFGKKGDNK